MNIAQKIISKFGGVRPMSRLLHIPPTTIQYWWETGSIPTRRQQHILNSGLKNNIQILPEDFFMIRTNRSIPDEEVRQ